MGEMAHQTTKLCQCSTNHSKCIHTTDVSPSSADKLITPCCTNLRDGHHQVMSPFTLVISKVKGPKRFQGELRCSTKYTLQLKSAAAVCSCNVFQCDTTTFSNKSSSTFKHQCVSKVQTFNAVHKCICAWQRRPLGSENGPWKAQNMR